MVAQLGIAVGAQYNVSTPMSHLKCKTASLLISAAIHCKRLVAHLPSITIRAMKQPYPVKLAKPWLLWQFVDNTACE
ncbi:hypothetical protein AM586_17565 [Massilia sp. WG5]|nr:hypothetical protein AM586_17565 [Massilia sp. WG5]